jgi:hypothetical protein
MLPATPRRAGGLVVVEAVVGFAFRPATVERGLQLARDVFRRRACASKVGLELPHRRGILVGAWSHSVPPGRKVSST